MNEIYIYHKDWNEDCILENNKIYRKNNKEEFGNCIFLKNKLTINWDKWNQEFFFFYNDSKYFYSENIFYEKFNSYVFIESNAIFNVIIDKKSDNCVLIDLNNNIYKNNYEIDDEYIIIKNEIVKRFKKNENNIYILASDLDDNKIFQLKIVNNLISEDYLFLNNLKVFYLIKNFEIFGIYEIIENCLIMEWNNGYKKKFYSNKYLSNNNNNNNIHIIKPNKVIYDNKILFSNISLCKKKIIFTSINYKNNNWNIDDINIIVHNNNIINKSTYNNDHYETSFEIVIEVEYEVKNVSIEINYKNNNYSIYLEQLNINEHKISAMTLFNDDYQLLKKYLKYYNTLGVEIFYLYYNKKIDYNIIENIIKLNENNLKIYLTEWNYYYWHYYDNNSCKHHHAQSMAINDSLHILKQYGKYTLYNDLDEYIVLENGYDFNMLIENDIENDIFIFKNRFCKIGNHLIKYENFYKEFDLTKIIEGNFWEEGREKNLIKLEKINVMGVHSCFKNFSNNVINEKIIGQFYHIINFKEKYREELMTQYIT